MKAKKTEDFFGPAQWVKDIEAIKKLLILQLLHSSVRSVDIAEALGVLTKEILRYRPKGWQPEGKF